MVIQEGPAILGYERFREQEERSSYGLVQDMVGSVLEASTYDLDEAMMQTFSRIFFGAMSAAGETVSDGRGPEAGGRPGGDRDRLHPRGHALARREGVALPDPEPTLNRADRAD